MDIHELIKQMYGPITPVPDYIILSPRHVLMIHSRHDGATLVYEIRVITEWNGTPYLSAINARSVASGSIAAKRVLAEMQEPSYLAMIEFKRALGI